MRAVPRDRSHLSRDWLEDTRMTRLLLERQWRFLSVLSIVSLLCSLIGTGAELAAQEPDRLIEQLAILASGSNDARMNAALALGGLRDARAVDPLIGALSDRHAGVRRNAAHALGTLGDRRAVDPLLAALKDGEKTLCEEAAAALGELGDPRAVQPLIAALDVKRAGLYAVDGLRRLGEAHAVDAVVDAALHGKLWTSGSSVSLHVFVRAIRALGRDRAVDLLLAALQHRDSRERVGAAMLLGPLGDTRAVEPLVSAAKDADDKVRLNAVASLAELRDGRAVGALIVTMSDPVSSVRQWSADALGMLKDRRALDALIRGLDDTEAGVRMSAAHSLWMLRDRSALVPLVAHALKEPWKATRYTDAVYVQWKPLTNFEQGLRMLAFVNAWGGVDLHKIFPNEAMLEEFEYLRFALRSLPPGSAPISLHQRYLGGWFQASEEAHLKELALSALTGPFDESVRQDGAFLLAGARDPRLVEPLIVSLRDRSIGVTQWAAAALWHLQEPQGIDALEDAMLWEKEGVSRAASFWLREDRDTTIASVLIAALSDRDAGVRARACDMLGQLLDPRSVPQLIAALGDSDARVRFTAAMALARLRDARAVDALVALLSAKPTGGGIFRDDAVFGRWAAVNALGAISDPRGLDALVRSLKDPNAGVRVAAARALAALQEPRSVDALVSAQQSERGKLLGPMTRALGALGGPAVIEPLVSALSDKAPQVRWEAAQVLGHLKDARAIQPLARALSDEAGSVRLEAARALEGYGDAVADSTLRSASQDLWVAAGAHRFFISRGLGEAALVRALQGHYADRAMMTACANSGNASLEVAAKAAAARFAYIIPVQSGAQSVTWGQTRQ